MKSVCGTYGCGTTYEINGPTDKKTVCPKCGFSESDIELNGTNDPDLLGSEYIELSDGTRMRRAFATEKQIASGKAVKNEDLPKKPRKLKGQ